MSVSALVLVGCASVFTDPLQVAYESGKISKEEYDSRQLERHEALARESEAHWELQQTISQNRAKLPSQ